MTFIPKKLFWRGLRTPPGSISSSYRDHLPLSYSWIINGKLAVGPIPKTSLHWRQLEDDGFSSRFSCCYPYEHIFPEIPHHWLSGQVSLPDHRGQEELSKEKLCGALQTCEELLTANASPLYLHCFAGQERSVLVAIGLVCILKKKDLFDSLNYVKQCHGNAKPLYNHLETLDQVLKEIRRRPDTT
jgi:hypothetical protein